MSFSTTLPNKDSAYTTPIYNEPKNKQLRASLSKKHTSPKDQDNEQLIMQQWHELMQKIQSERQEISELQKEADEKQIKVDKNSLTPELKKLMDQVQDLKDDKRDLDDKLAQIRQFYTPEAKSDIDNEVSDLRRDFFFDTEALETVYDNISKMKTKSKNFYDEEPAKSVLEAEKRITELTHKKNDLYRESAQIDVDFEEVFNPSPNSEKKENRKVTYLKRKLKLTQDEVEKRNQMLQKMAKEHEKEKEQIMLQNEEEERKKKFRAEMSKSRRREMIAQQCKSAGYDTNAPENNEKEKKNTNDEDIDLEKVLGLEYDLFNSTKRHGKKKKASKKKKSTQQTDANNTNVTNENNNSTIKNKNNAIENKNNTKKTAKNIKNINNNHDQNDIFQNIDDKKANAKKEDFEINEEKDLVNIGQEDSDSEVQIIGDNEAGELSKNVTNSLLSKDKGANADKEANDNGDADENEVTKDQNELNNEKQTSENENGEDNKNVSGEKINDDEEYVYIDCEFNQITLLDVSPESFSKTSEGNFSSMLTSGLGLIKSEKDPQKVQFGKIKVIRNKQENQQNNFTLWSSHESEDTEEEGNYQSSINILPLYDFEYNQDWKIVSKTLKSKTQPAGSLRKYQDQIDDQRQNSESETEISEIDKDNQDHNAQISEKLNNTDQNDNQEKNVQSEGQKLSSVINGVNSLFSKTEEEERNENNKEENNAENKDITQSKEGNANKEAENNEDANEEVENEEVKKPDELEDEDKSNILNGVCGTSPNRGDEQEDKEEQKGEVENKKEEKDEKIENKGKEDENEEIVENKIEGDHKENEASKTDKEKKQFEITVVVDGFLREDRPTEHEEFDSIVLINISPSPLFAKLSDAFKKKGIISAGKFNYDI